MYVTTGNIGQTEEQYTPPVPSNNSAQTITAVAELTRAVAEPAAQAYSEHVRAELNAERIKAGLPPLGPPSRLPPPPPPQNENYVFGGIALLIIIFLLMSKS